MMLTELQCTIAQAVQSGAELRAIEDEIIDRAPIDEEQKSVLWLYAEALADRLDAEVLTDRLSKA